jgi:hypothetical protein
MCQYSADGIISHPTSILEKFHLQKDGFFSRLRLSLAFLTAIACSNAGS